MAAVYTFPSRWVVLRFSALGDVALTTGVLQYWHETRGWDFIVVTRRAYAPLFKGHPAVRAVIGFDVQDMSLVRLLSHWRQIAGAYAGYGLLDLHGTLRTRLMAILWPGAVRRYAKMWLERRLCLASRGYFFQQRLLRWNVPQRYAAAVEVIPPRQGNLLPRIYLSAAEHGLAECLLAHIPGMSAAVPPVAIHPYATHPDKAWPTEQWVQLSARLEAARIPWFVIGQGSPVPGIDPAHDLTSKTSLRETCALLHHAAILLTGDSGPMHLSCAVGTPVIAMFGPTTKAWGFFPAGSRDRVLEAVTPCRPCTLHGGNTCPHNHACMKAITVEQVMQAVISVFRPWTA